ncbi:hypothetical protein EN904_05860 [Mesorhizobium sp. M7A.F.Ca.CA.001.07.2.1]|nr:hypothetical protein EN983_02690 [Mesorhizobium sp. M7A.F.Ca.CA.004.08.2.1]RUX88456.1 hypothetical protein EN982_06535 [Mesorhizobium sp. M7A.F.Ca.CA.004.08.1.1]RUY08263.1 hypothetical protein EN985_00285 [Mesorhizobium sp. M7A.F.Ca.CA.004.04.1.1]RUY33109.1 hypothetical protein EN984_00085 [Mesorhizobium sp. M7A.F.Ca.CA.004.12.1.1]RUY59175.1 hypothetical protein EN973_00085 [Mesorhizobium sp. M7A.F.Ca.CA.001.12.1.1]RUY93381.1 hypothetical protein EN964_01415 [Mesorhizobium sp. M7A.F.Ca.CA.0
MGTTRHRDGSVASKGDRERCEKLKQHTEATDREKAIEALYFARKCGLTKEEALKMLREAQIRIDDGPKSRSGNRT